MNAFKKFAALLLALMMILSLAACGSKSDDSAQGSSDGDASSDDTAKSKIEQIKEAGVLVMGTSADYPPNEFHTEVDSKDTIVALTLLSRSTSPMTSASNSRSSTCRSTTCASTSPRVILTLSSPVWPRPRSA